MKKNIGFYYKLFLFLLITISSSCKELPNIFSKDEALLPTLPSNSEILKVLYKKISKKDFEIEILSKNIKSLSKIKIEREKFFKDKKNKTSHVELCQGIQVKLTQLTKRTCSLSLEQSKKKKPFTHCLKRTKTSLKKCKKWVKPLFFAKYCNESKRKGKKNELSFLTLPKGHRFKTLLRVEMCKLDGKKNYSLRQFKLDGVVSVLQAQKI